MGLREVPPTTLEAAQTGKAQIAFTAPQRTAAPYLETRPTLGKPPAMTVGLSPGRPRSGPGHRENKGHVPGRPRSDPGHRKKVAGETENALPGEAAFGPRAPGHQQLTKPKPTAYHVGRRPEDSPAQCFAWTGIAGPL